VRTLKRRVRIASPGGMLLLVLACSLSARASIIVPPLTEFTVKNTAADGFVQIAVDGLSFVLTGGNTGSGTAGTTDFTTMAATAAMIMFQYSYSAFDTPGFDSAGYIVGGSRVQLANADGEAGVGSLSPAAGQTYGWYVATQDNTGEPGILTVTFTPTETTVPEPCGLVLGLTGAATFVLTWRRRAYSRADGRRKS
jgi:hypothetical protein